ncbi:hypothetical protein KCU65_g8946, partial [Aureobasidium melanogenum]
MGRGRAETREDVVIPLSSLRMKAGNWKELYLIYSWEHKAIQFSKDDETLCQQGSTIQLGSKHVQTVFYSRLSSPAVVLCGSKDIFSSGRVWLEFATTANLDGFLKATDHMNDRAKVKDLETDKFTYVCESNETFFVPEAEMVESELGASSCHPGREQISATRNPSPRFPTTAPQEVMHTKQADSLKLEARTLNSSGVATNTEPETDIQTLKNDIDRLEREIAVLDRKLQSVKDEAASTIKTEEDGINTKDDVYKRLEKELEGQKSKKEAQITKLHSRIKDLISHTIKGGSESGNVATANVASKRIPAKRKRKF